jgi:hypothetical protein
MRSTRLLFAALLALCCATPALGAVDVRTVVAASRAPQPLPLDPALSDPAWSAGTIAGSSFQDLTTRRPAPVATTVSLLYDDRNLYVAFRAEQRGIPIVAGQTTNNVGFGIDDFVGIGIDTGASGSQVYYFETTPRGTRYQQASENARYAPAWDAAARVRPGGWDAVMIVPLGALRLSGGGTQRWRVNFIRQLAATGEHLTWAFDGLMSDGAIPTAWPNFLDVRFWPTLADVRLARRPGSMRRPRADVFGLLSVGRDRNQFAQADGAFAPQQVRDVGLDVTAPLSDTVNFVGTLAPDFSNVEVDQQTIAPQEFRRQLTEYRPFFAQGAAFLNPNPVPPGPVTAPGNVIFYSPSIGPFDRGAKIEGTHGNDAFGVLSVRGYDQMAAQTFDDVAYGFRHALPDRRFLYWTDGVLAHHSVAGNDETLEAGMEGRNLRTGFVWLANTAIEHSSTAGIAHSSNAFVDVHKPNYEVFFGYNDVGPHYDPLDGFTATSDIRGPTASVALLGNGSRVKNWTLSLSADRFLDGSGAVHQADVLTQLTATFKNGFSINALGPQFGVLRSYDVPAGPGCSGATIARSGFGGAPCYRNGETDRFNLFTASFGYHDGTPAPIDWSYAFGPFGGSALHQFTTSTSRPLGGRFSLSLEYDGSWESAQSGGTLDSQFLRKIALGASLDANTNVALALRAINGTGGFAVPGHNISASFHRHFSRGDELYVDFGTPAATQTLDRLIVKYVLHLGGIAGT